jgi:hypothetical protein
VPQLKRKRLRGGQPGPRPLRISEILVIDPHGDRVKVLVREFRLPVPFTQIERKQVAYELSSGERLLEVDKDTFKSTSTGAKFVRIPE